MSDDGERIAPRAVAALTVVDQRHVALLDDDEVLAMRAEDGEIYVGLRSVCLSLGVAPTGQVRRIQADEVMAEGLREVRVRTATRGLQTIQGLRLDVVPYWLSGIEPRRTKPELRDRLVTYKRWVVRRVWEAFAVETGIGQTTATATTVSTTSDGETLSLAHIRDMALAIAAFAEQQIAFAAQQQVQDRRIDVLEEGHGHLDARLDRAAGVVGGLVRSVKALEQRLAPGNVLTEEQAAEVSDRVKTVAEALTARDVAAGAAPRDWYGSIYRTLYKRYNVAGYRRIRQEQYADALSWLGDFHAAASSERRVDEAALPDASGGTASGEG